MFFSLYHNVILYKQRLWIGRSYEEAETFALQSIGSAEHAHGALRLTLDKAEMLVYAPALVYSASSSQNGFIFIYL